MVFKRLRIAVCVLFALAVWGFSRGFLFKKLIHIVDPADIARLGESSLVTSGLFPPVIATIGVVVLSCYVLFFVYLERRLYGSRFQKGLIYGSTFALMYLAAFLEFFRVFNGLMSQALLSALADGGPLLLTGLLSGPLLGTDTNITRLRPKPYLRSLLYVAAAITLGRMLFYNTIYETPNIASLVTVALICVYGISVGISYYLLTQGIHTKKAYAIPVVYSLVFLPIALSGNTLVCLKSTFPFSPMIALTFFDVVAIILGGLITEYQVQGSTARRPAG